MLKIAFTVLSENMDYFMSLDQKYIQVMNEQIRNTLGYEFPALIRIATETGHTALQEEIQAKFDNYYQSYLTRMGQAKP